MWNWEVEEDKSEEIKKKIQHGENLVEREVVRHGGKERFKTHQKILGREED